MLDLSYLIILVLFCVPLLAALLLGLIRRCSAKWILGFETGLMFLGLVGLGVLGEREIATSLFFLGEEITFSVTNMPILLFLSTLTTLVVMFWHYGKKDPLLTRFHSILLSLSFSFGLIALLSGQFMIRYIAIDVVGLLAAMMVLTSFADIFALKGFIIIFQVLRLGDLGLLAAILLMNHYTGTLEISEMISATTILPLNIRTWIYFGFMLALLIKLAIWPFGIWLQKAGECAPGIPFWISGILTPALGYYLLYRILPIIHSELIFVNLTLYIGLGLYLLVLLVKSLRLVRVDQFTNMSGLLNCFLLAALAINQNPDFLVFYFIGLIFYRMTLVLQTLSRRLNTKVLFALVPLAVNGIFIGVNFADYPFQFSAGWVMLTLLTVMWDIWAIRQGMPDDWQPFDLLREEPSVGVPPDEELVPVQQSSQLKESGWIQDGVYRLTGFMGHIAEWVYDHVEMRLDASWDLLGQKLVHFSELTWHSVEMRTIEKTGQLMDDALKSLQAHERNVLKRSLRWDLAWIPMMMVIILIMLFVF